MRYVYKHPCWGVCMKKSLLIVGLVALALPALCDGAPTMILWSGWNCASTEDVFLGRKHTSFPLTYLFDGKPATTWVFSGTGKHGLSGREGYGLHLSFDEDRMKPVMVDSIWIMNGYNKSRELFLRNNRITEMKLYVNQRLLRKVSLTDKMGWHRISIPRQWVGEMYMQFTRLAKGRDNDVCVSELALYDRGKKIDLKMPQAVMYTEGDVHYGQVWRVISRSGKRIAKDDSKWGPDWSPSGKRIAGCSYVKGIWHLWVVDATAGRVIYDRPSPLQKNPCAGWPDESTVRLQTDSYPENPTTKTVKISNW